MYNTHPHFSLLHLAFHLQNSLNVSTKMAAEHDKQCYECRST